MLLWTMLLLNVTAGIGVLGQASPMIQEMFPGTVDVAKAAGFVGFRFLLGAARYALVPSASHARNVALFVAGYAVIMTMYGRRFRDHPRVFARRVRNARGGRHPWGGCSLHGRALGCSDRCS